VEAAPGVGADPLAVDFRLLLEPEANNNSAQNSF